MAITLILKWHTNDSDCDFTLFYSRISRSMAFYLIDGNIYWRCFLMQILTWYFERSVVRVIKISPELNADFKCPHPKLEICHKSQQVFATQKCWRQILCFCMFIVSRRLFFIDVIWCFMYESVETNAENYQKWFIVKFLRNRTKGSIVKLVRFFRSVYLCSFCCFVCILVQI